MERCETVALLGPSGSGKSTLLALAAGLDQPSAGEIRAFGSSLGRLDERELAGYRSRVALVFQSENLCAGLTAEQNVLTALRLSGQREDARERALDSLAAFGLEGRARERAGALSGGEQQRIGRLDLGRILREQ